MELHHRSDYPVRLTLKTLDDSCDDLGCARASHGEVDERLVPCDVPDFFGHGKFVFGNQGAYEEMIGRQFDTGKSGRLRDQRNITAPVIENRIVTRNTEMFCCVVYRVQEPMLHPEIDKRQDAPIGNGLDSGSRTRSVMPAPCSKKSGSQVDCTTQTRGMLRNVEHAAGDWNRRVRPGDNGNRREPLESDDFVLNTLNHLRIRERRRELLSAIDFGERFRALRDTHAMREDQFVEIPRKRFRE
jgi:hypothetical protein